MNKHILKLLSDKRRHSSRSIVEALKPKIKTTKSAVNAVLLELQREGVVSKVGASWRLVSNVTEIKSETTQSVSEKCNVNAVEAPVQNAQEKTKTSLLGFIKGKLKGVTSETPVVIDEPKVDSGLVEITATTADVTTPAEDIAIIEPVDVFEVDSIESPSKEPEEISDVNVEQVHVSDVDAARLALEAIGGQNQLSHKAKMAPLLIKLLQLVALEKGEQLSHMLDYVKEFALPLVLEQLDYRAVDILTDDTGKVVQPLRGDFIDNPTQYLNSLIEVHPNCSEQQLYQLLESNWLSYVIHAINQREFTEVQFDDLLEQAIELYGYAVIEEDIGTGLSDAAGTSSTVREPDVVLEGNVHSLVEEGNQSAITEDECTGEPELEPVANEESILEMQQPSGCDTGSTEELAEIDESKVQEDDDFPSDIFGEFVPVLISLRKHGVITEATIVKQFGGGRKGNRKYGRFSNSLNDWQKAGRLPFDVSREAKSEGIEFRIEL